jgi:hypothetical protein
VLYGQNLILMDNGKGGKGTVIDLIVPFLIGSRFFCSRKVGVELKIFDNFLYRRFPQGNQDIRYGYPVQITLQRGIPDGIPVDSVGNIQQVKLLEEIIVGNREAAALRGGKIGPGFNIIRGEADGYFPVIFVAGNV